MNRQLSFIFFLLAVMSDVNSNSWYDGAMLYLKESLSDEMYRLIFNRNLNFLNKLIETLSLNLKGKLHNEERKKPLLFNEIETNSNSNK